MSLVSVKMEIAEAVRANERLARTTFHYPEKRVTPPGFVVTLPDDWNPTITYQRGSSNMVLMGWLVLPLADARGADELACGFYEPSDPTNLVALIQDRRYDGCAKVMVDKIKFEPIMLGETVYLGARNVLNVFGLRK